MAFIPSQETTRAPIKSSSLTFPPQYETFSVLKPFDTINSWAIHSFSSHYLISLQSCPFFSHPSSVQLNAMKWAQRPFLPTSCANFFDQGSIGAQWPMWRHIRSLPSLPSLPSPLTTDLWWCPRKKVNEKKIKEKTKKKNEIIVAKALHDQRYPMPLSWYMWEWNYERGSSPGRADDLWFHIGQFSTVWKARFEGLRGLILGLKGLI